MANVFGGVENAPSGDQINMTFQKMAGTIEKRILFGNNFLIVEI